MSIPILLEVISAMRHLEITIQSPFQVLNIVEQS